MSGMTSTPPQARNEELRKVPLSQRHVSHEEQNGFQNLPQVIKHDPLKDNIFKLSSSSSQLHHALPLKRRYPILITFLNGQPIPHPLRIPPPQSPIRKPRQKAFFPPLRAQPAIIADVMADDSCREAGSLNFVHGKQSNKTIQNELVTGKRCSRRLVDGVRVRVNAYRKLGKDCRTIAKLLPGRSPLP